MRRRGCGDGGFTLIELIVVIAIIATLAAITIPNLIESRKAANETSAIMTLRAIVAAQQIFRERDMDKDGTLDFAQSEAELRTARLLHYDLTTTPFPTRFSQAGYAFAILPPVGPATFNDAWRAYALPLNFGRSGDKCFFVDETGVIRFSSTKVDVGGIPDDFETLSVIGK